ncbi:MAG: glycyl-radical enzyme activating protein [Christensenellaceae bacterium]|jgi:pyruvate formate lyase activating enzyme|nr:glycyl-radical enzyme activating protein [Christensenellaceae bacterium]
MEEGTVFDIQRFSLHDGTGIRTIVFLKGCSLECMWCSNPESKSLDPQLFYWQKKCIACKACMDQCPQRALSWSEQGIACDRSLCTNCGDCCKTCYAEALVLRGRRMSVDEVFDEVLRDQLFYSLSGGGLTLSGGEPVAQPGFARALLQRAKQEGMNTAIETAGNYSLESLQAIDPFVDMYLFDVKHTDAEKHKRFTGKDNGLILKNLAWLADNKRNVIVRVPVIPGFNDDVGTLQSIVDLAIQLGIGQVSFLPYHEFGRNKYAALGQEYAYGKISGRVSLDLDAFNRTKGLLRTADLHINVGG